MIFENKNQVTFASFVFCKTVFKTKLNNTEMTSV